nr:hypothetical protein CFP56_76706 [Quercus suber]
MQTTSLEQYWSRLAACKVWLYNPADRLAQPSTKAEYIRISWRAAFLKCRSQGQACFNMDATRSTPG